MTNNSIEREYERDMHRMNQQAVAIETARRKWLEKQKWKLEAEEIEISRRESLDKQW